MVKRESYFLFIDRRRGRLCGNMLLPGGTRKVQDREIAVVLFGGLIVSFCGFDFIVEVSDCFAFAVIAYLDIPSLCVFVPYYTLVFRRRPLSLDA